MELKILEDAKRLSGTLRCCRCDKAKVLRILNMDRTESNISSVKSMYDSSIIYQVGEIIHSDAFDEDRWFEYGEGIHFFVNFQEAVNNDTTIQMDTRVSKSLDAIWGKM